jgi:hypothetical protein
MERRSTKFMEDVYMKRNMKMSAVVMLLALLFHGPFIAADNEELFLSLTSSAYVIEKLEGYDGITMEGFYTRGMPGAPELPQKTYDIQLPSDANLNTVSLEILSESTRALAGAYEIAPAPFPATGSSAVFYDNQSKDKKDVDIYGKDEFYPSPSVEILRTYQAGDEKVVRVQFTPLQYNPVREELQLNEVADVRISWTKEAPSVVAPPASWQGYAIVTTNATVSGSSMLTNFQAHLQNRGFTVYIVTETQYGVTAGQQRAANIRTWLINNRVSLKIQYVLLIGNPDPDDPLDAGDSFGDVPMMMCWPDPGEPTPTDYFYADLTGDWDSDGDNMYGEYQEDNVDFGPDAYVGRIPLYSADYEALDSILSKIINYDGASQSIMLPMAISNYENQDYSGRSRTDGLHLPEYVITNIADFDGYSNYVMYEESGIDPVPTTAYGYDAPLTNENVMSAWASDYGIVFWWAHGNQTGAYRRYWSHDDGDNVPETSEMENPPFMSSSDTLLLADTETFVFQCSCENGWPEDPGNLGYALLKRGSITTVSASRISWYIIGTWYDRGIPDNAGIGYAYVGHLATNGESAGKALYNGKNALSNTLGWIGWMNLFDFNLYGDPSLTLQGPPIHEVALIDDDNGRNFTHVEDFYTSALDALGISYDYFDTALLGSPHLAYLQAHSVVIWFTGSDFSTTLSVQDENNLIQYLNGGGKLFFSSQDYIWDLKNDGRYPSVFLRSYLHSRNEGEDTGVNSLIGVTGNEVGDGLGPLGMCWLSRNIEKNEQYRQLLPIHIRKIAYNPNAADYTGIGYPDIPSYDPPLSRAPGLVQLKPDLLPNFQVSDENFSGTCAPGDVITFYIEIYSEYGTPIPAQVEDNVPLGMNSATVSAPGVINDTNGNGIIGDGGDTVVWNLPALSPGYTLLTYQAHVLSDGSVPFGSRIVNEDAIVHYDDGTPHSIEASPVAILVQAAYIVKEPFKNIACTIIAPSITGGSRLYYRLTVYNSVSATSPVPFTAQITDIEDEIPPLLEDPQYHVSPFGLNPQPIVGNTLAWHGVNLLVPGSSIRALYSVFVPLERTDAIKNAAQATYSVPFPPPAGTVLTILSNETETTIQTLGCNFIDYADWVERDAASDYAFFNENGEYLAITYSGDYKVVFFAFRFEGIHSASDRQLVMDRIFDFFGPIPTLGSLGNLFDTNTFLVAGDKAYCTDVLGSAKIAFALAQAGTHENPEGRTDVTLTQIEHDTGNLIPIGGPAVNPVATEFGLYFNVTYNYQPGVSFEISADSQSIYLDLNNYPNEDTALIYLGKNGNRSILLVWGYGWQGTYAASVLLGNISNWDIFQGAHMIMLRWKDWNFDGLVQESEIMVEVVA